MSALRESAGTDFGEGVPDRMALVEQLAPSVTAPPIILAGDPDDDDGEPHICRGID